VTTTFAQTVIPNFGRGSDCVRENHLFCWGWVKDNWGGTLAPALGHHIVLTLIAVAIGFAIAFSLALLALRVGWVEGPVTFVTGILYTVPSIALFQLLVPLTSLTDTTAEIALVSYTLLILFRNVLLGLRGVPEDVLESARGMGLTEGQLLWRVQLPLALPAIVAGLRIATVTVISLATIAAYISVNSLGAPIFDAIQSGVFKTEIIAAGALAIALALLADGVLVILQRALTPWARAGRTA
jgi:osmoprotectant transport system permease protein